MRVTWGDILAHVGHRPTSAEIRVDVRARQARRKALKPLLSELFLPYNLPDVLLTKVLRRPARGTSDDPVMVFDDDEGKRADHPIEVG